MGLNKFFMLGLAGLAFTACSNNDELPVTGNEEGKVFVNLSLGSAEARSLSTSAAGLVNDINDMKIYFYTSGGSYVDVDMSADSENGKAVEAAVAALKGNKTTTVSLTGVPSSANRIYVVINNPQTPINIESIAKVKASTVYLNQQVKKDFVRFSGESSTLTGTNVLTNSGDVSTVTVQVRPVPARMEIQNFIATEKPTEYLGSEIQSFEVAGVYMNAFYTSGNLDDSTPDGVKKVDNLSDPDNYSESAYTAIADLGDYSFMCDDFADGETEGAKSEVAGEIWKVTPTLADVVSPYWGYQVLKGDVPHIVVKLNVMYEGDSAPETRFLTITGYHVADGNVDLEKVERGKVYRITDLKFNASDLTPTPYEKDKTVNATVEVLAWEPVEITPDL